MTTFTIDGIIKPDGSPVILEYNRGINSGSTGYRSFTGKSMIERVIGDLQKAGFDDIWFDGGESLGPVHLNRRNFPRRYIPYEGRWSRTPKSGLYDTSRRQLIYPPDTMARFFYFCGSEYLFFRRKIDLEWIEETRESLRQLANGGRHVEIADYPAAFDIFYTNKVHISRLLQKGILDPAFYPRQKHYAETAQDPDLPARILQDFKGAERIMVKHAALFQGKGVIAVQTPNRKKIKRAIKRIKAQDPWRYAYNSVDGEGEDIDFIAQEFIESRSMSLRQSFMEAAGDCRSLKQAFKTLSHYIRGDDRPRNYAFRLFISYVNGTLILHDGWLKFSDHPSDGPEENKFISGRQFAGPLSEARKRQIFEALSPNMLKLFRYLETQTSLDDIPAPAGKAEPAVAL